MDQRTFKETVEAHFKAELAKDGHTLMDFHMWGDDRQVRCSERIMKSYPLDKMTQAQATEGVELGFLNVQRAH